MTPATFSVAVTAIPLGIAFGFVLERAGLGDPRVIAGQFVGRDFSVVRVMFGAIATAMLGAVWLDAAGVIDLGAIAMPPTDAAAQALGAVIFGGGFAVAALCPGTACVAAASGRWEGFATVGGLLLGSLLTAPIWPLVRGVVADAPREGATLPADLGLSLGTIVVLLTVLAIVAMMVARRLEHAREARPWRLTRIESVALALAIAFLFVQGRPSLAPARIAAIAGEIAREEDHVDALELAEWIRDRRPGLRIIDVREGLDGATYRIPGSVAVPLDSLIVLTPRPGEQLVLYSDGGAHAAQAWVLLRARGFRDAKVLKDGMAAWDDEVLHAPVPRTLEDSARKRFERARDLSLWFGGQPRLQPLPNDADPATPRRRRRNTC